jgi:hypothetical protein
VVDVSASGLGVLRSHAETLDGVMKPNVHYVRNGDVALASRVDQTGETAAS